MKVKLTGVFYYLAFILGGVITMLIDRVSFVSGVISVSLISIGLFGLLSFLSLEIVDEYSVWFKILGVIRRIVSIILLGFALLMYVSAVEKYMFSDVTFIGKLWCAFALTPASYILIRSAAYCFTFDIADEVVSLIVGIVLPFVTFGLSLGMVCLSFQWSFAVLFVVWLLFQIFVRGSLNGFGRFVFNFVFYGAIFALSIYFAAENKPLMAFSCMAMAFCFFYFLGIDLCRESTFWYWAFNILGIVGCLACLITGLVGAFDSGLEGMKEGISCSFGDALKNGIYFMPFVYMCLRPPLYKLAVENEWEEGLGDVFVTFFLPVVSYILVVPILMIGFVYVITGMIGVVLLIMLIMYFKDEYVPMPDFVGNMRDSVDNYISTITIIE